MRVPAVSLLVVSLLASPPASVPATPGARAQSRGPDATAILQATRDALGGQRIATVTSFVATGRTRQLQGNNLVPIEFEISAELPAKYVRRDEIPARESGPTTIGFNGTDLIQVPVPAPPAAQAQAMQTARLTTARQDFARLTLGMFASSFEGYPLTFAYAGEAEAPQGKADVLAITGAPNFNGRLFIHRDTHLPLMVSWTAPGGPPQPGQPPTPVEQRLYYSDYRDVGGLKLPFRLRRAVGGDTIEETTFDRFRINPRIDPKKFDPSK